MKIVTQNQEKEIEVSKIASVNLKEGKEFIYFDLLNDGTWRMVYTEGTLKQFEES